MTSDRRESWEYRLRYWNARRGTALLRACERIIAGRVGTSTASRPLATRPPDRLTATVEAMRLRHPAEVLRFPARRDLPEWLPRDQAIPSSWSYCLAEASVAPESGAVWGSEGAPVVEVMGGDSRYSRSQDVRGLARRSARERIRGTWAVLPSHTYYHFLVEDLPALLSSLAYSRDHLGVEAGVLAPANRHRYVSDALSTLPNEVHATPATKVTVQRLAASGFLSSHVHPSSLATLRAHFGLADTPGHRWLYVSRVGFRRSMPQEQGVIANLRRMFPQLEVVEGHTLSLTEQVSLFAEAAVVMGTHGAGLSNVAFSPSSARVVEIATPANASDHFWRLAAMRQQTYQMVWAGPEEPAAQVAERILSAAQ